MSRRRNVEISLSWVLALTSSKCQEYSVTPLFINILMLALVSSIILSLIFWAHPGGPAWGKYKWRKPSSSSSTIPGPKGIPIIGSMGLMTGLAHQKLAAAAEAADAKRLMALSLGQTRAIVTCNPEVGKQILISSTFADRPVNESAYQLMFNRSIGFAPYGLYWTTLRKIADAHLFSPNQLKASEHQRLDIANQLVKALCSAAATDIRVRDLLKRASLNSMMCSVFGRKYDVGSVLNSETEELHDLVDQGYHLLGQLNWSDHLSFLAHFDLQKVRFTCSRLLPRVNRFVARVIADHKAATPHTTTDFVHVLLSLQGPDKLSTSDMISLLWEMIFRGTDTVAVLIEWILARLVLHPDVQSKVHGELDKVVGRSRAVKESDLTELIYLTAVVKEVLRLHPPGPLLSWSRLSIRDSVIDGCHVPMGTTAMVNMWAIMRDPQVWNDPLLFNPDRFLGPNPASIFGSDMRIAPFGSGRRSCPGKSLGMATVNLWVATLLQEFEFESCSHSHVDLSEELRLSCEMANPLMVRLRPRRTCISISSSSSSSSSPTK